MKFKHIFGNPPFQDNKNRNKTQHKLWIEFTQKAVNEWMQADGTLTWITPMSWGSPSSKILTLLKDNTVKELHIDTKKYFPKVGSTFCHYHVTKGKSNQSTKIIDGNNLFNIVIDDTVLYLPNDVSTLSLSIHKKVMFSGNNRYKLNYDYVTCHNVIRHAYTINKKKIVKKANKLKDCEDSAVEKILLSLQKLLENRKKIDINVSEEKTSEHIYPILHTNNKTWFSSKKQDFFDKKKVMWSRSGYTKPFYNSGGLGCTDMGYYILVDSDSAGKDLERFMNSKLMKYIFKTAKWSGFGNELVFSSIPKIDILKNKTDSDYFACFGISPKEIDYINSILSPTQKSKSQSGKEKTQFKSEERIKNLGEIYTPKVLVDKMLDTVSTTEWQDETATFLDPACGNGNFLINILIKRLENGVTLKNALMTLHGVDIMQDNIDDCHNRIIDYIRENNISHDKDEVKNILNNNIVLGNTLLKKMKDIF
jgi:hypothetical protein